MIPTKIPDKKGPRFRQQTMGVCNAKTFKAFYKKFPQHKKCSNKLLTEIIFTFNGLLREAVVEDRDGIELPEELGTIFIGSCKPTFSENRNYGKSNEVGVRVPNRNLGSDGYLAKIFYSNFENKYKFKHRQLWKFKGSRDFTQHVSRIYREEWPRYLVIEEFMKISALLRSYKKDNLRMRNRAIEVSESYNEFDLD